MTHDDTKPTAAHTPEPWFVQPSDHPGGLLIKPIPGQVVAQCDEVPEMEASARRIVAAVNACKGLGTEALERGIVAELRHVLGEIITAIGVNWDTLEMVAEELFGAAPEIDSRE